MSCTFYGVQLDPHALAQEFKTSFGAPQNNPTVTVLTGHTVFELRTRNVKSSSPTAGRRGHPSRAPTIAQNSPPPLPHRVPRENGRRLESPETRALPRKRRRRRRRPCNVRRCALRSPSGNARVVSFPCEYKERLLTRRVSRKSRHKSVFGECRHKKRVCPGFQFCLLYFLRPTQSRQTPCDGCPIP